MRHRFPFLLSIILLAAAAPLTAQTVAHYFDLSTMGTIVHAQVNGFDLCENSNPGGFSHSEFITPYLVPGKNEIVVTSLVPDGVEAVPNATWVKFGVVAAPADQLRSPQNPGKPLVSSETEPVNLLRFPAFDAEAATVLDGKMLPNTGPIRFASKGARRWAWGLKILDQERLISGRPASIQYVGLNQTLALAEFHFLDSKSGRHLSLKNLKLPAGGGAVDLAAVPLASGIDTPSDTNFDTIWIFGFSAEGIEEVRMLGFDLVGTRTVRRISEKFEVDLPHAWSWQKAADVSGINANAAMRGELTGFLKELHAAIDTRPAREWPPFFEAKLADLAKATGKSAEATGVEQVKFFESLTATQGWKLEPFDPARLLLAPVNDRVVSVSYVDSAGPILSVPLIKPGSDKPDRFKMPLFVAKIGEKWTVVR